MNLFPRHMVKFEVEVNAPIGEYCWGCEHFETDYAPYCKILRAFCGADGKKHLTCENAKENTSIYTSSTIEVWDFCGETEGVYDIPKVEGFLPFLS